jgi:hypothetical protein
MINSNDISAWSLGITKRGSSTSKFNSRSDYNAIAAYANNLIDLTNIEPERVLLTDEYHAIHGYINGFAEVIDAASEEIEGLINLIKPATALVLSSVYITDRVAGLVPEVYVLNTLTSAALSNYSDDYTAENVETISYNRFFEGTDTYDLVVGYQGQCSYLPRVLDTVLEKVKPGGVFILQNASDFGSAYRTSVSVGNTIMQDIIDTDSFHIYHYASTVSFAICIKK